MNKAEIMKFAEIIPLAYPTEIDARYTKQADKIHYHREFGRRAENTRLLPLIEALATSNEKLVEALMFYENGHDTPKATNALSAHKELMERLK